MTSLFAWQRAVLASDLGAKVSVTALRIGLDSTQATGRDVVVNDAAVAADLSCSPRTVWRHVRVLIDNGWLAQTSKPTYGGPAAGGRRARYCLLVPGESSDTPSEESADDRAESYATEHGNVANDSPESPDTPAPGDVTRQAESSDKTAEVVCHDEREIGTLSAFGSSSNSSCSSVTVEILASKLRRYTALAGLRTDKLKPATAAELEQLIDTHGDQRLIDHVLRTLRRDDPPQTIQAFLPGWRVMPKPGQRLAAVPDLPCPAPGHSGTTRHCVQCASERLEREGTTR